MYDSLPGQLEGGDWASRVRMLRHPACKDRMLNGCFGILCMLGESDQGARRACGLQKLTHTKDYYDAIPRAWEPGQLGGDLAVRSRGIRKVIF